VLLCAAGGSNSDEDAVGTSDMEQDMQHLQDAMVGAFMSAALAKYVRLVRDMMVHVHACSTCRMQRWVY
jgi:hypothetical protein